MEYYASILGNLLFSSTNPFCFSESPKLWQPISSLFQHQIQNNAELQTGNRTHQHLRQMRSGLFGRTPLRFQDGTVISPIRRCILNGICYGNGEAELLDSHKFCGLFRVKCASGHRKIVLPVPRRNCHFLPFSDAFWMEYVMGMQKRNCRFCGTFCVKCGDGQGNIPWWSCHLLPISDPIWWNMWWNGEAELVGSHSCVVDSMWNMQVWSGIYCSGSSMEVSSSPNLRCILNGIR